jgi:hypothetical protein
VSALSLNKGNYRAKNAKRQKPRSVQLLYFFIHSFLLFVVYSYLFPLSFIVRHRGQVENPHHTTFIFFSFVFAVRRLFLLFPIEGHHSSRGQVENPPLQGFSFVYIAACHTYNELVSLFLKSLSLFID